MSKDLSQTSKLRVAVVGAGNMGVNHIRVYCERPDVEVVGIVDTDEHRAATISALYDIPTLAYDDLPETVDAVSLVVPSSLHRTLGVFLLEHKIHCLIEKPLALSVNDSQILIDTARAQGVTLLVGHVEEYNQGFRQLKKILHTTRESVRTIFCQRFNYGSDRVADADVILDLMIHDLGCVLDLVKSPDQLRVLSAHGMCREGNITYNVDMATATLATQSCIVSLQASRMSHQRHREFVLQTDDHSYVLDFVSQQVYTYKQNQLIEQTDHVWVSPLEAEIDHFLACVRSAECTPITSGERARKALGFVEDIQNHVYQRSPLG